MTTRQAELQARRRQHRKDARRRLLDAAHELLERQRWAEISLDDITTSAEVARTAFYRHFDDRQRLLLAMLDDVGLELDHVSDNWLRHADDSQAELRASLDALIDVFVKHGRLLQAISDTARHDEDVEEVYGRLADRLVDTTANRITAEVAAGRSDVAQPSEVSRALTWMNERYLLASFGHRPFADRTSVLQALETVWINTLYRPVLGDA